MEKAPHQDLIRLTNKHLPITGKPSSERKTMNYYEAMRLLDRVKDGQNIPTHLIRQALILTGDIDEDV